MPLQNAPKPLQNAPKPLQNAPKPLQKQPEINAISASIAEELKSLFTPVVTADILVADQPLLIPAGNHHIIATTGRQAFHLSCTFREPAMLHLAPGPYRLWSKKIIWVHIITSKL